MQKSGFPKMHHYVGFWQIRSQIYVLNKFFAGPTRDATIHILGVSAYHFLCITVQWHIAWYSIANFCRWWEPFFQNHHVLYLPNSYRTIKLAYNHSISHKTVHIICSVKVKTWIYHAQYSIYRYNLISIDTVSLA